MPWWRHGALAGAVAGLLGSARLEPPVGWLPLCAALGIALVSTRPGREREPGALRLAFWLLAVAAAAAIAGLGLGDARLRALAAGAAAGEAGSVVVASGFVLAPPKRSAGELRAPLRTEEGRLLLVTDGDHRELSTGDEVRVRGVLADPEPWRAGEVGRLGARLELRASRVRLLDGRRGGIEGMLDRARDRAESGLSAGLGGEQAALARGFVLGQDDRVDPRTREQFKRSGLAHLLAVSGQNVMLLAVLAGVLLGLAGIGQRLRLLLVLALIALFVPIAGAGPSIQRAGTMGAAGIVAALAGRPADRAYLPLLAAAVTLALNPLAAGDVGWQLSFAAVIGIALWGAPLRERFLAPARRLAGLRAGRALAEGAALTVAASVATAPLTAHHFESFSAVSVPANLLALVAVPPVMWLGMLAALLGQVPLLPTAPIGLLEGPLISYLAAVADLLSRPDWALARVSIGSIPALIAVYAALLAAMSALLAVLGRRSGLRLPVAARIGAILLALAAVAWLSAPGKAPPPAGAGQLRMTMLDVGQGDAILIEPPDAGPLMVDAGPPGAGLEPALRRRGIDRLEAVLISHDQLDHVGGLADVLAAVDVGRVYRAEAAPNAEAAAREAGVEVLAIGEGSRLRFGSLELQVLWPPREGTAPAPDPNRGSLVIAARLGRWGALLPGDAEAEFTHLDPGPIDLLKLAHHGSEDAGLGPLLDRSAPRLALIGVGAGNPHGHPSPETIAELERHRVCVLRTDLDGEIWAEIGPSGLRLGSERGGHSARPGCGGPA